MKLCYQAATPDVQITPSVTAFQGGLKETFSKLAEIGYDGVELMTFDPSALDWDEIKKTAENYGLALVLVCTGEIYGQLGWSFTDESEVIRRRAVERVCNIVDFAGYLGANINIGRVRGQYQNGIPKEATYRWALDAFREISRRGQKTQVKIALEPVTIIETNFINTAAEAAGMADDVHEPNFKLMMDVFHMNIEEKNICETIRKYKNRNIHVHLADNNRRYPGHCGMDFERIIQTFRDSGYDGAFCAEIFQIPDQESAAEKSMEYLAPVFHRIYGRPLKGDTMKRV
jgi:sugar phosphate isomerase/epimerase